MLVLTPQSYILNHNSSAISLRTGMCVACNFFLRFILTMLKQQMNYRGKAFTISFFLN